MNTNEEVCWRTKSITVEFIFSIVADDTRIVFIFILYSKIKLSGLKKGEKRPISHTITTNMNPK